MKCLESLMWIPFIAKDENSLTGVPYDGLRFYCVIVRPFLINSSQTTHLNHIIIISRICMSHRRLHTTTQSSM